MLDVVLLWYKLCSEPCPGCMLELLFLSFYGLAPVLTARRMCGSACWEQREFKLRERELTGNKERGQTLQSLGEGVESDKASCNQVI